MSKFWLVVKYTYLKQVRRKSFLLATLGIPIGIALVTGLAIYIAISSEDTRPVGYVDQTGLIDSSWAQALGEDEIIIVPFEEVGAAQDALEQDAIQGFFVLPEGYPAPNKVDLFFWDEPISHDAWAAFNDFLRLNFIGNHPAQIREIAMDGPELIVVANEGQREFREGADLINWILPVFASFFFFMAVMSSGGYLLQAVTDEKENRTMEILSTSLTPDQLIGGKTIGLLSVALTQILLWLFSIVIIVLVGRNSLPFLQALRAPWDYLLVVGAFLLPTFVLIAGIMTAIGSMVTELSQGQQISGLLNMVFMSPWFMLTVVLSQPNNPVLTTMSMIPFTAFMAMTMRFTFTSIPFWQLAISWSTLVGTAALSVWLSARIFRMGMLRYGQRLKLKDIFRGFLGASNGLEIPSSTGEVS
ncbi:MAG: ABC transporter permease [Anaerolineales bacterium]|nr:ABC transporter permease [Anaerolineales bacterium]